MTDVQYLVKTNPALLKLVILKNNSFLACWIEVARAFLKYSNFKVPYSNRSIEISTHIFDCSKETVNEWVESSSIYTNLKYLEKIFLNNSH